MHARVLARVAASTFQLARKRHPPDDAYAPKTGTPDHYVLAGRDAGEHLYRKRIFLDGSRASVTVDPAALGLEGSAAWYVSVAAVDAKGHESLFAYPEQRCEGGECTTPPDAMDILSTQ